MPEFEDRVVWAGVVLRFADGTVRALEFNDDPQLLPRITCRVDARKLDPMPELSSPPWRDVVGRHDGADVRLRTDGPWTFYPAAPPLWYAPPETDDAAGHEHVHND